MLDTVWAPVISALGAALLTGGAGFGAIWWQQRRQDRGAAVAEQARAYTDLLTCSSNFIIRAQAIRIMMERRTGLQEGVEVALGRRKPIDVMSHFDWAAPELNALMDAWARVWYLGTQAAIDAADRLVSACNELLELAASYESKAQPVKRRIQTHVVGVRWNEDEDARYQAALRKAAEMRATFVQLMRKEFDQPPVELAIERALANAQAETAEAGKAADQD